MEKKYITFVSISLSRRSLTVHPAPRKRNAPQPNKANIFISGRFPGDAAKVIDLEHNRAREDKLKII